MRADRKSGSLCEQVNTLWGSRLKVDIDELCNNTAIFTKHCVANEEHCKEYYSFLPSESLFYTEDGFPTPFYQSPR